MLRYCLLCCFDEDQDEVGIFWSYIIEMKIYNLRLTCTVKKLFAQLWQQLCLHLSIVTISFIGTAHVHSSQCCINKLDFGFETLRTVSSAARSSTSTKPPTFSSLCNCLANCYTNVNCLNQLRIEKNLISSLSTNLIFVVCLHVWRLNF